MTGDFSHLAPRVIEAVNEELPALCVISDSLGWGVQVEVLKTPTLGTEQ
jgi:hypothetical protein